MADQPQKQPEKAEGTVKARVLFDTLYYRNSEGKYVFAKKGDVVDLPESEFERFTSDEAKLSTGLERDQLPDRIPVERADGKSSE
jgi:hypothetical protein